MLITFDDYAELGYIYLIKPGDNSLLWERMSKFNMIDCYINKDDIKMETINIENNKEYFEQRLSHLRVCDQTYIDLLHSGFTEPWENDKDKNNYITGIEFDIEKGNCFLTRVKDRVYRIGQINFQGQEQALLLLNYDSIVLDDNNIIAYANDKKDSAYILHKDNQYDILYVEGIIFTNDSPYNIDYLSSLSVCYTAKK